MARIGRNEPCPCGSGRKAKRCCGTPRGPSEEQVARAYLAGESLAAALVLHDLADDELLSLYDEAVELPERYLDLHFPLPPLLPAPLQALLQDVVDDDFDRADDPLDAALERLDSPVARAHLARQALALRDAGRLSGEVAAVAVADLASDSCELVAASLVEAAAVAVGGAPTPGGLVVAHRFAA